MNRWARSRLPYLLQRWCRDSAESDGMSKTAEDKQSGRSSEVIVVPFERTLQNQHLPRQKQRFPRHNQLLARQSQASSVIGTIIGVLGAAKRHKEAGTDNRITNSALVQKAFIS